MTDKPETPADLLADITIKPTITREEAQACQRWAGMDGATSWHLIDRHADNWADVGLMMDAWLEANRSLAAGKVDKRTPIAWAEDCDYGRGYSFAEEFFAAFPSFPKPPATPASPAALDIALRALRDLARADPDPQNGDDFIALRNCAVDALRKIEAMGSSCSAPESDEVLIAIKRGEAYEDVHPQLVAEDALRQTLHGGCQFEWRVVDVATPPASAPEVTARLRRAAERTRDDLGPTGTNYPDVRVLLAFAEAAIALQQEGKSHG